MNRSSNALNLRQLLTLSVALSSVFLLFGCNDEVRVFSPCDDVVCGDNASCDRTTGACECDAGFEMYDGVCEAARCKSDQECDDGVACNGAETCDVNTGQCQDGTPVTCDENALCEEPSGDCVCAALHVDLGEGCEPMACEEDIDCDDSLVCNGAETCNQDLGQCQAGTPIDCGQDGTCEEPDGICACPPLQADEGSGCEPISCQQDADCDDALACNGAEVCDRDLGICAAGNPVRCGEYERCEESADGNICVVDAPQGTSACMLIGTTDWGATGSLAVMDLETGDIRDDITTYAQDSAIRVVDQEVYILERHLYDAVLKLDQRNNYETVWNFSVATDDAPVPNPHDLVRHGDYFFLALYNEGVILRANVNPNASDPTSFLGATPYTRRIEPPSWDGAVAELTALRVEGDILYGLTQGLDDGWACGSPENKGRVWAFNLPDLTDANVFEGDKNYLDLAHCNPGGWVPMPDGRLLIHSLGGYRSIHGEQDDGGLQIFDIVKRKAGPVVATESTAHDNDIFSIVRVGLKYFAILAGSDFDDLGVHEVHPTADDSMWSFDAQSFYNGYAWTIFGFDDTLYIAERSPASEALYRYGIEDKTAQGPAIETVYAPETMQVFYREGGCW